MTKKTKKKREKNIKQEDMEREKRVPCFEKYKQRVLIVSSSMQMRASVGSVMNPAARHQYLGWTT